MVTDMLSGLLSVIMVLTGFGVWSLVLPNLLVSPVNVIGLWVLHPWRPKMSLEMRYWKDIFQYGKYVFGTTILRYGNINGDYMITGKLLGPEALGLYRFAYNLANWPIQSFVWVIGRVVFPAFARLQHDLAALRELYLKTIEVISLVAFPCFIGLMVVANDLIPVVYGKKWIPAILPLQIIFAFTLIRSIVSPGGQILLALGKPHKEFTFNALQIVPLFLAVTIGAQYGIVGVAVGMSLVLGLFALLFLRMTTRAIELKLIMVARTILPALVCSVIMGIFVHIVRTSLRTLEYEQAYVLLISVGCGVLIYPLIVFIFFRQAAKRLVNICTGMLGSRPFVSTKRQVSLRQS